MRVFTEDIRKLLNEAIAKFEESSRVRLEEVNNADFFKLFTADINKATPDNDLNPDTVYKQYHIKLKNYTLPEIGFSSTYLNAICKYARGKDYSYEFGIAIEDESEIPEFPYPPYIPCFPATPAILLDTFSKSKVLEKMGVKHLAEFNNIWIKDESVNPCGTFKDRFAWEVYLYYNDYVKERIDLNEKIRLPRLSLISNGNAALSIQYLLRLKGLPNLKVILDKDINQKLLQAIKMSGCEVYQMDLKAKRLSSDDVCRITNNEDQGDITFSKEIRNKKINIYDWLSFEILNLNPQHLFIPYGSGDLFKNIYQIWVNELKTMKPSKRFFGNKNILSNCNYFGACTSNKNTKMKMLYAPFNSYFEDLELEDILKSEHIGKLSAAVEVKESYVDTALKLAEEFNISCEPSGVAGISLFLQLINDSKMREYLNPKDKYVIVNTGKMKLELFQ